jgi:hypothetical protein
MQRKRNIKEHRCSFTTDEYALLKLQSSDILTVERLKYVLQHGLKFFKFNFLTPNFKYE